MKARKVVTRSGRGFRGYFPSKKLNRLVEFESILERDAIKLFENSNEVIEYREQPTIVYYYIEGEQRKYYPDFELILESDQVVHVEVKPILKLTEPGNSLKYQAINEHYFSRPEYFVVFTETQIRLSNSTDFYALINNDNLQNDKGGNHATFLL